MKLLYCDASLAVVNKEFGELSEDETAPSTKPSLSVPALLRQALRQNARQDTRQDALQDARRLSADTDSQSSRSSLFPGDMGDPESVFPVHRLDRTTAGLMVLAREKQAAAILSRQAQTGEMQKRYLALVHGSPILKEGVMTDDLFYDRRTGKAYPVSQGTTTPSAGPLPCADQPNGSRRGVKRAVLSYQCLETYETRWGTVTLAGIALLTGRTHQIRAQFAARGTPLLGDGKYGSRANYKGCALFSTELSFRHPKTNERLRFTLDWENPLEESAAHQKTGTSPIT